MDQCGGKSDPYSYPKKTWRELRPRWRELPPGVTREMATASSQKLLETKGGSVAPRVTGDSFGPRLNGKKCGSLKLERVSAMRDSQELLGKVK